ncbi:MAG: response regulator, partial [Methylococcaceae bacterium]|nr:response regulator [Methylococcaceae bacterium]
IEIDSEIPETLLLDGMRLRQLLFNLLGNAVKFTHDGYVKMIAEKAYREHDHSILDLIIKIQDTGIGIPKSQQDKIFHIFEQQNDQSAKKYGGTGLGLSICKRLTEMMNGELLVESDVGKGTTFSIVLHSVDVGVQQVETESQTKFDLESISLEPATILVVDDIDSNRAVVKENFVRTAITIKEACNGEQAIALVRHGGIDLVLMDIRMPVMGGFEAAEQIKSMRDIPIIALTASVLESDYEKIKSSNFDGYLRKPVLRSDLFEEICRFLPFQQRQQEEIQTEPELSTQTRDNLETIIEQLENELYPLWQDIQRSNKISSMNNFAEQLEQLANEYQTQILQDYSGELKAYIQAFDIKNISVSLNRFEALIAHLKTYCND